jgi:hydrogenase-4 component F
MTILLVLVPFIFALGAYLMPSDRLRPWLLPTAGGLHLALVLRTLAVPPPLLAGSWVGIDPLGRLVLLLISILFLCCGLYGLNYLHSRLQWGNRSSSPPSSSSSPP